MKRMFAILLLPLLMASLGGAAPKNGIVDKSSAVIVNINQATVTNQLREKIKKINAVAASERKDDEKSVRDFTSRLNSDIDDIPIDKDLANSARDKSLDWRTRYLLLGRIGHGNDKKISKDEEMTLYSDALLDKQEHERVRKLAAWFLMEPAKTNAKARQTLSLAAKDKTMPGPVLESVMVSVGYAGIDDVDALNSLMERDPKTNNEIGINLNAVRALGKSKDPRAIGMLFKILDESQPDSFYNATALEQFFGLIADPVVEKKIRPMLVPRMMKLLDDRSHYGVSRQQAGRMLLLFRETKAIDPIIKWLKPQKDGGGGGTDTIWAAEILAEFGDKRGVAPIEEFVKNYATDERSTERNHSMFRTGGKRFPEDSGNYIHIQECLKKLKGLPYNKKKVILPWW